MWQISDMWRILDFLLYMLCGMKETVSRPQAPAGFAFENHSQGSSHSTGRCGRQQNLTSLLKCILVLKCWMKERNSAVLRKDAF